MNIFTEKKIFLDSETVAEQLRSRRQELGLKLEKIAKEISINFKYLEALEKGNFNLLPAGVYGKNFLREYAVYLKIDYRPLVKMFEKETAGSNQRQQRELFSKQVVKAHHLLAMPKIIKSIILVVVVGICLFYLSYRLKQITAVPSLNIQTPADNLITKEKSVSVTGIAEAESQLIINGESVISDTNGSFVKEVDLKKGINIISITAQKKYGRSATIKKQILVE
ncbi:MAG: hypothetical protein UT48_C0001G0045 [Parcubacteria group bacterium GW2011_GWE2_39_37]|uniref:HTH cro/C1-type domain-containing protein n=1 Tax=Candidatus Falkowbacteria bacterium GW2011_GWF2_39_8 TaxID=1618642 RepID=A0A0G0Q0C7_9BACT|nr:MAG: hypothetical protein UT48_C0001G0045 [Parcubacteria group bacterium GW2011_GWE2_39_37]KKR33804.1 MAG: hypothetical protein UT64_C0003G0025 [Candidatus Falkowbacteria bacterium GW2011_GWF2_39_8]